ncbi:MAG: hypothetical protein AAGF23_01230 [Acidobacteriota bacterium]
MSRHLYLSLPLSLLALVGCDALPSLQQDACDHGPWVEQVYGRELALWESCGTSAPCLEKRAENIEVALAAAPDEVDLHRIYQFVRKNHGPEAEKALIEEYRRRSETRGTAVDLYLYARLLSDDAQKTALYEKAVRLDDSLPWPHEALMEIYASAGDPEASDRSRRRFLELCPRRFEI